MPRLSDIDRGRAIGMLDAGTRIRAVATALHVHESSISRLRNRYTTTGRTADRPRSGRPRVTTNRQNRYIVLQHLRNRRRNAAQTAREKTQWAHQHRDWTHWMWNQVPFSDESRFCLSNSDGRVRVYRRNGERFTDAAVVQHDRWGGPSVMVWTGITSHYRTELFRIQGNLTGLRYRDEILMPAVLPFMRQHPNVTLFQQDNARPHTARIYQAYLQHEHIQTLPWPAFSPDMSPIKHLWDELGRRVHNRQPQPADIHQLQAALVEEWQAIPQVMIQRLLQSMRTRVLACIAARGGHTRY
jgi:transposase